MKAEDYVVVIGCGPIGLAAVRLAKLRGALAYDVLLRELHKLGRDIPVILEHLSGEEQYRTAAKHLRNVAAHEHIGI